jgi:hypothetical protein
MPALARIEHREGVRAVHPCVLRPLVELGTTPVELGTTILVEAQVPTCRFTGF